MREIDFATWDRRDHFHTFGNFQFPHFNMCADLDLTAFRPAVAEAGVPFTAALVYVIARTANDLPQFRQRIRGATVVEHDRVHPATTILVDDERFSFCSLNYSDDLKVFAAHFAARTAEVKNDPTVAVGTQRDDQIYMTAIPWVSFTSFSHPMPTLDADSIPRFAWGKFHQDGPRVTMPLSVQGHHGLMDGLHVGRYFARIDHYLHHPEDFLT